MLSTEYTGERDYKRARAYAAKLSADTLRQGLQPDLSTDGMLTAFANCVRPAKRHEIAAIRSIFLVEFASSHQPVRS